MFSQLCGRNSVQKADDTEGNNCAVIAAMITAPELVNSLITHTANHTCWALSLRITLLQWLGTCGKNPPTFDIRPHNWKFDDVPGAISQHTSKYLILLLLFFSHGFTGFNDEIHLMSVIRARSVAPVGTPENRRCFFFFYLNRDCMLFVFVILFIYLSIYYLPHVLLNNIRAHVNLKSINKIRVAWHFRTFGVPFT